MNRNKYFAALNRTVTVVLCTFISIAFLPLTGPGSAYAEEEETAQVGIVSEESSIEMETAFPNVETADNDALLMQYLEKEVSEEIDNAPSAEGAKKAAGRKARKANLSGPDLIIYEKLASKIQEIAAGDLEDTVISIPVSEVFEKTSFSADELGVDDIITEKEEGVWVFTEDATEAFQAKFSYNAPAIVDALLADMPYELYWYDKTKTGGYAYGTRFFYEYDPQTGNMVAGDESNIEIEFRVAVEYSKSGKDYKTTKINKEMAKQAAAFVENTSDIITSNEGQSDYGKLNAYKEAICVATAYNDAAAGENKPPYGNPWQMIWVFDNNPETTVVCEGYAKAFQFLCNNTAFSNTAIDVNSVTGDMICGEDTERHMWNIVRMKDDKNYMVDVTNCDEGSVGAPDLLFMTGAASGSVNDGYTYSCDGQNVSYIYDTDTRGLFEDTELELSAVAYDPAQGVVCSHDAMSHYDAAAPGCTEPGNNEYWYCSDCGLYFADSNGNKTIRESDRIIPATGHTFDREKVDDEYLKDAATCTSPAVYYKSCTCGEKGTETFESGQAPGHDPVEHVAEAATCTTDGNSAYWSCDRCNRFFSDEGCTKEITENSWVIPAGHKWGEWERTVEPTQTKEGTEIRKCTACEAEEIRTVDMLPRVTLSKTTFTWNKKAQTPAVYVRSGNKDLKKNTDYTVTLPKGRTNVGTYAITVKFKGNYSGTKTASYTIVPKGSKITRAAAAKRAVTLTWAKQASKMPKVITGYQIQYSLRKDFKSGNKAVNVGGYTKTSGKITGLASKKTYYFRIRTYSKIGSKPYYSSWSAYKAVKVK